MKKMRWVISILLVILFVNFVSADVDVRNLTLNKKYAPYDLVSGIINLTIEEEELSAEFSSNLWEGVISLEDFLNENSAYYECNPFDCSSNYEASGSGSTSKIINLQNYKKEIVGFVLNDDDVYDISSLSFDIESNFAEGGKVPLKFEFFEDDFVVWEYKEVSNDYSREQSWGCWGGLESQQVEVKNTRFCSKMNVSETSSLKVGANISVGNGSGTVDMIVYDEFGDSIGSCDDGGFNPSTGGNSCMISFDEGLETGNYYVCLEADTDTGYKISRESGNVNNSCGWSQSLGDFSIPSSFSKDFPIFIKLPNYASSSGLKQHFIDEVINDEDCDDGFCWDYVLEAANYFIYNKCVGSDSCVLPITVSGVSQSLTISNINLDYRTGTSNDNVPRDINKISILNKIPPVLDFSGVLELEWLGFDVGKAGKKDFVLELGSEELIDEEIEVLNVPIIKSVYPTNPAAGIMTTFSVQVDGNATSYFWDFGDNSSETTTTSFVNYMYKDIGAYTLTINLTTGNFTTSKSFTIIAGSPRDVVGTILKDKRKFLNESQKDIQGLASWLRDELEALVQIDFYENELDTLELRISNAFSDEDYLDIAIELYELNVPRAVFISETGVIPFVTDLADIDVAPVIAIAGGTPGDYANAISQWQRDNMNVVISNQKISVSWSEGGLETVMSVYDIDIDSSFDGESYFVIGALFEDLNLNTGEPRKAGDYSVLVLDKFAEEQLIFYVLSDGDLVFYASPKLGWLPTAEEVDVCNNNGKCDEGEDSGNCSDCKPYVKALLYIFFVFVFGLIVYTVLQIWYKTRYESSLFKDRRQLFNVLMFIDNVHAQGIGDEEIKKRLKGQGWSGEKIAYALKKSRGETTGMYEIIPVEPVLAWWRQRQAEKRVNPGRV